MSTPHNIEDIYPLSYLQEGILFHSLYAPGEGLYVDHIVCDLQAPKKIDTGALQDAFQMVVDRHQALRTAFVWKLNGKTQQVVLRKVAVSLTASDWSDLEGAERERRLIEFMEQSRSSGFDLSQPPLLRLHLFHYGAGFAKLVFSYHHIIMDAWSVPIVFAEVQSSYEAFSQGQTPKLSQPRPFRDYISWQRKHDLASAENFWRKELEGISGPTLLLSERHDNVGKNKNKYADARTEISLAASDALRSVARSKALTLNTILQGAWACLLGRCSNSSDVLFGTVVSGRPYELQGIESLVGLFTNSLPTRVHMAPQVKVVEWFQKIQKKQFEVHEYEWSPLAKVQEWSEFERNVPLFESVFIFQNIPLSTLANGQPRRALELSVSHHDPKNNFPLSLMVVPGSKLSLRLLYDTRRFSEDTIQRGLARLAELLAGIPAVLDQPLSSLSVLTESERDEVLNSHSPVEFPPFAGAHEVFACRAAETPNAIAVACQGSQLTYAELNERADKLAGSLQQRCGSEEIIVIAAERNIHFLIAILGVFKAGRAYLPLDIKHPSSRMAQVLRLSGSPLVLAQKHLVEKLKALCVQPGQEIKTQVLDLDGEILQAKNRILPSRQCASKGLAYVIFTSGSTGVPKGAMIEHGGMLNHLYAKITDLHLSAKDVIAQTASQCFDISVWQFLAPLLVGGRVEIFPDEVTHDPALLLQQTASEGISILETVPSMLRALLDENGQNKNSIGMGELSFLVVTGEELPPALIQDWFQKYPGVPLVNAYGPTECSDDVTHHIVHRAAGRLNRIPIGRCVANMRLFVLDFWKELAPIGVMGELFVGGAGVGRGYLNDPVRTAESFVPDPFSGEGNRLYRTGDLVSRRPDGAFDFYGRIDSQLKIRGFRIELGDIESLLATHPSVLHAVVLARKMEDASLRLSAYVVPDPGFQLANGGGTEYQLERTAGWKTVFDEVYGQKKISETDDALHLRVWTNTYTDQPFPEEEIFECIEDSVARIKSLGAKKILELGCGPGLLLFRMASSCDQYWCTDISSLALRSIEKRRGELGTCDVRLFERPAHDFDGFARESFDLIILNEIVQYFPDGEYLDKVLSAAIAAVRPGGSIFVGGVRNLHLLHAFHASVELFRAPVDIKLKELDARIHVRSDKEKELLVAPEFFTGLPARYPRLKAARVMLKGGRFHNEFTRFRYDAILRVEPGSPAEYMFPAISWAESGGNPASLLQWLSQQNIQQALVTGIPNARTALLVKACRVLANGAPDETVEQLHGLLQSMDSQVLIDPEQLKKSLADAGFCADALWSSADSPDSYSVVLGQTEKQVWEVTGSLKHLAATGAIKQFTNLLQKSISSVELIAELRKHAQQTLPDYMVPSDFVVLPALPLTPNGKVDRQALSFIEVTAPAERDVAAELPPTVTEELVMSIWAGLLEKQVGRHSNFFESGGHSLLATQVMSRLKKTFQIDLPLRALFDAPTVIEFARTVDAAVRQAKGIIAPPVRPVSPEERRALSYAQQRLWIMDQMEPGTYAYNLPNAVRIKGELQIAALIAAFNETIRRHESLRTTFRVISGQPQQVIAERLEIAPLLSDLSGLEPLRLEQESSRLALEEGKKPFDIHSGPLLRAHILRSGPNEHVVLFTLHHIISDAWSAGLLVSELAALYGSYKSGQPSALEKPKVQYADFASWQRRYMAGDGLSRQLNYWKQQLAGAPNGVKLPLDFPRPQLPGLAGQSYTFQLSPASSRQLQDLARKESATLFMTTLAAFKALLYRVTGQKDVVVGTDIANRNQPETERLIGFFVNLLVLRTRLANGTKFRKLLGDVREVAMEAFAHQDLPFDILTRELRLDRAMDHDPLFDVLFVFQNAPAQSIVVSGAEISPLHFDNETARFDLALFMQETSQGLSGKWVFRTDLFSPATVSRLSAQFELVLENCAATPDMLLEDIPLFQRDPSGNKAHSIEQTLQKFKSTRPKVVSLPI